MKIINPDPIMISTPVFRRVTCLTEEALNTYLQEGLPQVDGNIDFLVGISWLSNNKMKDCYYVENIWKDYIKPFDNFLKEKDVKKTKYSITYNNTSYLQKRVVNKFEWIIPKIQTSKYQTVLSKTKFTSNIDISEIDVIENGIRFIWNPPTFTDISLTYSVDYELHSIHGEFKPYIYDILEPLVEKLKYSFKLHYVGEKFLQNGTCLDFAGIVRDTLESNGIRCYMVCGMTIGETRNNPHFWNVAIVDNEEYPIDISPAIFSKMLGMENWRDYLRAYVGSIDNQRLIYGIETNPIDYNGRISELGGIVGERYGYRGEMVYNLWSQLDWNWNDCAYIVKKI